MKTKNRNIKILWKNNPTVFERLNRVPFATPSLTLGSHPRSVNSLLSQANLLALIMPTLIGSSVNNDNWQEKITDYLDDFHLDIPKEGIDLEIGYNVDLNDSRTKDKIESLIKEKNIKFPEAATLNQKEEIILDFITNELSKVVKVTINDKEEFKSVGKVTEENLYEYVSFINNEHYLNYRYILNHNEVANKVEYVNRSTKIRFFLSSEAEEKAMRKAEATLRRDAMKYCSSVINNEKALDDIIILAQLVDNYTDFKELEEADKIDKVLQLCDAEPARFLSYQSYKNSKEYINITKLIWSGLINKLPDSEVIVDSHDSTRVIGNGISEAISFFANPEHKQYYNELIIKYQQLMS